MHAASMEMHSALVTREYRKPINNNCFVYFESSLFYFILFFYFLVKKSRTFENHNPISITFKAS